jgi:hypothetical protein
MEEPTLEDPISEERIFFWPSWRFGRVLDTKHPRETVAGPGAATLTVQQAQRIGALFGEKGLGISAKRYTEERPGQLARAAADAGGSYHEDYTRYLDDASARLVKKPDTSVSIRYRFVPIVGFPRFVIELGRFHWLIREAVTVCAATSRSKAWMHSLLIQVDARSTRETPLSSRVLSEARSEFEPFRRAAMDSFIKYYESVLTEDVRKLTPPFSTDMKDLVAVAETELVGLATLPELRPLLVDLERIGLRSIAARCAQRASQDPASKAFFSFLAWVTELLCSDVPPRAQLLNIPLHDEGVRSSRALFLSGAMPEGPQQVCRIDLGAVLTEHTRAVQEYRSQTGPDGGVPGEGQPDGEAQEYLLNQVATNFLANEYGRYH